MARLNENFAYDYYYNYNRYFSSSAAPSLEPKYEPVPKKSVRIQKKQSASNILNFKSVLLILIVSALAFSTLYISADVNRLNIQLQKAKSNLGNIETENQQLQIDIDRSTDLKALEEYASNNLGMTRPEKYQTIYVNLKQNDYVEIPNNQDNIFSSICGFFVKIFSYIN